MRARVFHRDDNKYRLVGEFNAGDADEVWRILERSPHVAGRSLRPGDVVYVSDIYHELNGDGGWRSLEPGDLTRHLYGLVTSSPQ